VTVEATEAIARLGAGLSASDLPCESDREPHAPIDPENDRQPEKGMCGHPWLMAVIVELIRRNHQARAHFPNFLTTSGIKVDKVHVALMYFGNSHQFHSSVSKCVAVG